MDELLKEQIQPKVPQCSVGPSIPLTKNSNFGSFLTISVICHLSFVIFLTISVICHFVISDPLDAPPPKKGPIIFVTLSCTKQKYSDSKVPFWAAAPKGPCPVGHRGVLLSIHPPLAIGVSNQFCQDSFWPSKPSN